jgi:hypothetical protein
MTETRNNTLVALLLVVVVVLAAGMLSIIVNLPVMKITGAASGVTNLTISSLASIKMLRNISEFGSGTPSASTTIHLYSNATNTNGFSNGTEGNGTVYGLGTYMYPFVIENDGNDDSTCVNVTTQYAAGTNFIGGTSPVFELASRDNETSSCASGLAPVWVTASTAAKTVCSSLHTEAGGTGANTIRIHWHLAIPQDAAPATYNNVITISGYGSC